MPAVYAAFDHSPCIFHWLPLDKVTSGTLNVQAHLSPFSEPDPSYHAPGEAGSERTVDVQINRLRRKIEIDPANPLYLQTVRGAGYRILIDP